MTISNCICNNPLYSGIWTASSNIIISNCVIVNSPTFGIYITNQNQLRTSVLNNIILSPSKVGIYISGGKYNKIEGNVIDSCPGAGGYAAIQTYGTQENLIIRNNTVRNSGYEGMRLRCNYSIIDGNYCHENGQHGIRLVSMTHSTINGNICINNSQSAVQTYSGLKLESSNYNTIVGNVATGSTQQIGINEQSSDYNIIANNIVKDNSLCQIKNSGINDTVINNKGYMTENKGALTFSSTGSQTQFLIPHGLTSAPTVVELSAKSKDAAGEKYWTADANNITVNFVIPPQAGTNNIILSWKAEV